MVNIHWKTNQLSKADKKKVRDFIKHYVTDGLTIIFTDNWKMRYMRGNRFVKLSPGISVAGLYFPRGNGWGSLFGFGGVNNIRKPLIAVNATRRTWYRTFLHEFGHYIDDTTNGGLKKHQKCEAFANEFARHYGKNV
jgi:Zn-dependent peptidase ImmA (M78 family)